MWIIVTNARVYFCRGFHDSLLFVHLRYALFQGLVTVAPNVTLDHETDPQYLLTVMATDNVNGPGINKSTSVSVSVICFNKI